MNEFPVFHQNSAMWLWRSVRGSRYGSNYTRRIQNPADYRRMIYQTYARATEKILDIRIEFPVEFI